MAIVIIGFLVFSLGIDYNTDPFVQYHSVVHTLRSYNGKGEGYRAIIIISNYYNYHNNLFYN